MYKLQSRHEKNVKMLHIYEKKNYKTCKLNKGDYKEENFIKFLSLSFLSFLF